MQVFYMYEYTYMFLKQEKPETDVFEEEKIFGSKGKFQYFKKAFWKMSKFLMDTLVRMLKNIFAYSFVSEHTKHSSFYKKKSVYFSGGG